MKASPEKIWKYISDLRQYPVWSKAVKQVKITSDKTVGVGVSGELLLEERGQKLSLQLEILEYLENKRLILKGSSGIPDFTIFWNLEPRSYGTRVIFLSRYNIPSSFPDSGILSGWSVLDKLQVGKGWKMRIVDRILKKGLIRDLELLKAVVEGKKVDDFMKMWSY